MIIWLLFVSIFKGEQQILNSKFGFGLFILIVVCSQIVGKYEHINSAFSPSHLAAKTSLLPTKNRKDTPFLHAVETTVLLRSWKMSRVIEDIYIVLAAAITFQIMREVYRSGQNTIIFTVSNQVVKMIKLTREVIFR